MSKIYVLLYDPSQKDIFILSFNHYNAQETLKIEVGCVVLHERKNAKKRSSLGYAGKITINSRLGKIDCSDL